MRARGWWLSVVWLAGCVHANNAASPPPPAPIPFADLFEAERHRVLSDGLLTSKAADPDQKTRVRALLALGRVQELSSLDVVLKGLTDPDLPVRAEAAFATGLLAVNWLGPTDADKQKMADALRAADSTETEPRVRKEIIAALGAVGNPAATDRLSEHLFITEVQGPSALALGVAYRRGAKPTTQALKDLATLVHKELKKDTRYGAAYALSTSKNPAARLALRSCLDDVESEIRALCVKGLGEPEVGEDVDAVLLKKAIDDPDYRVAVEAVRALAKQATKCKALACPSLGALADLSSRADRFVRGDTVGGGQVLLSLAEQGLPQVGTPVLVKLRALLGSALKEATDAQKKHDLAMMDCRFAAAIDKANGELGQVLTCGGGLVDEGRRLSLGINELSETKPKDAKKRAESLFGYLGNGDPRVRMAAVQALGTSEYAPAGERLRPFLSDSDLVLAAAAASAESKLKDAASIPLVRQVAVKCLENLDAAPDVADALKTFASRDTIPELQQWFNSPHVFLRHAAAQTIAVIEGRPAQPPPLVEIPKTGAFVPAPVNAAGKTVLVFKTGRGDVTVDAFNQDAPVTVASIAALAQKGFFKNLVFHRIVPDFVAQGGDPRGDGNGGPGYASVCEINHHRYGRGAVGMALSGKDTGGSQFFFTLSPQPHLDGRYTVFGQITQGQEVADALLENDPILDVLVNPPPPN